MTVRLSDMECVDDLSDVLVALLHNRVSSDFSPSEFVMSGHPIHG